MEQDKPFTVYNLIDALEAYIRRHTHCHDVEERWFASVLDKQVLPVARNLRSGGVTPDEKKQIAEFRLSEIDKERSDKQREIDSLDAEARKLAAA